MSESVDYAAVRRMYPFATLTDDEWATAAKSLRLVSLAPGQALFHCGDAADSLYLLVSGNVDVKSGVGDEEGPPMAVRGPGAIIGEQGLLAEESRGATVVAATHAELWEIGRDALMTAVRLREPWAIELLLFSARGMARRLAVVDQQLTNLIASKRTGDQAPAAAKVAELEDLRRHLFTEWSF